jgi:serine phosphatase RsbU (regulator of sigma subunit)
MKKVFFLILLLMPVYFLAQNLHLLLENYKKQIGKKDTNELKAINEIGDFYFNTNLDSAEYFNSIALKLAAEAPTSLHSAKTYYLKAAISYYQSGYDTSLFYLEKSIKANPPKKLSKLYLKQMNLFSAVYFLKGNYSLSEKYYQENILASISLNDSIQLLSTLYNISLIHNSQGDFGKAIEYNFKLLDIAERRKDSINILLAYQGLGIAYNNVNEHQTALQYMKKAYSLSIKKKIKYEEGGILIDLSNCYLSLKQYRLALFYLDKAIELSTSIKEDRLLSVAMSNKGIVLMKMGLYKESEDYLLASVPIAQKLNFVNGYLDSYNQLSELYLLTNQLNLAQNYAKQVYSISAEIGSTDDYRNSCKVLYNIFKKKSKVDSALLYFEKYTALKDSFINEERFKRITLNEFNYQKKKDDEIKAMEKNMVLQEIKNQKKVTTYFIIGSIGLLILLVFVLKNYIDKKNANDKISVQKEIIEKKNKDILDSINYAKYIQTAILPTESDFNALMADSFLIYKPKDIVSGDFYFAGKPSAGTNTILKVFGVGDCTGHGVPGAFLTVLGKTFIELGLSDSRVNDCASALNYLNNGVYSILNKNNTGRVYFNNGMDIAICTINSQTGLLQFSGAKLSVYIVSNNSVQVLKGNTNAIGELNAEQNLSPYEQLNYQLNEGDCIYLTTDGYPDQFGGKEGKKFKTKRLKELLLYIHQMPMQQQKEILEKEFTEWKGEHEQVDDVTLMGVKFTTQTKS